MIIPIGHESSSVRRHPWVTYGLIVACLAVFLHVGAERVRLEEEAAAALREAVAYHLEHPYLESDPRLEALVQRPDLAGLREALGEAGNRAEGYGFVPGSVREEEQAELADLAEHAAALQKRHPFRRFGLVPAQPDARSALSHLFVHADWPHLVGNLFLLFLTGPFIEDVWGRGLYAVFYLLAGLSGAGLFVSRFPEATLPLIGASGAIAGCMGAFLVRHWSTRIRFFYWFGVLAGTFWAPAWLMLPLWFASELLMAQLGEALVPHGGGVAYWAHIGGFAFGALAAGALRLLRIEERFLHPQLEAKVTVHSNERLARALRAQDEGRAEEAFAALLAETRRDPGSPEVALALWDSAVRLGRTAEAAPVLLRLIRSEARAGQGELAAQHWADLAPWVGDLAVEPPLLLRLAPLLAQAGHPHLAVDALERVLRGEAQAALLARAARAARALHPPLALRAARAALARGELPAAERLECERIASEAAAAAESAPLAGPGAPPPPEHGLVELEAAPSPSGPGGPAAAVPHPEALELPEVGEALELDEAPSGAGGAELDYGALDLGGELEVPAQAPPRTLRVLEAVPLALTETALSLELDRRGKQDLPLERLAAVGVAAVRGLGPKAVLVVDLVLDWGDRNGGAIRVVRLRSDRFDPRRLVAGAASPLAALRAFVTALLAAPGARPLPDAAAARGEPSFPVFPDLAGYEREVLLGGAGPPIGPA